MMRIDNTPVILLVRPQMGENIGMAARAMANFGLFELRLVAPRDGWGEGRAVYSAAIDTAVGAHAIVRDAKVYATVVDAVHDLHKVFATTARERDQAKPVVSAEGFASEAKARGGKGRVCAARRVARSRTRGGYSDQNQRRRATGQLPAPPQWRATTAVFG